MNAPADGPFTARIHLAVRLTNCANTIVERMGSLRVLAIVSKTPDTDYFSASDLADIRTAVADMNLALTAFDASGSDLQKSILDSEWRRLTAEAAAGTAKEPTQ